MLAVSARDFAAILREKIFAATDQKKTRSKAEFDPGTLARFADALFAEGAPSARDFDALKALWEQFFPGVEGRTSGGTEK